MQLGQLHVMVLERAKDMQRIHEVTNHRLVEVDEYEQHKSLQSMHGTMAKELKTHPSTATRRRTTCPSETCATNIMRTRSPPTRLRPSKCFSTTAPTTATCPKDCMSLRRILCTSTQDTKIK